MESLDKIIKYENGEMIEEDVITFFQELIDSGMVCFLQGHYQRMALNLVKAGHCHQANVRSRLP